MQDALAENPEMLVDYVRIYTLEGQSVFVADPPEQDSSSGKGGSVLSMVTAVSVLVVLAVLFSLCVVRRKRKIFSKYIVFFNSLFFRSVI